MRAVLGLGVPLSEFFAEIERSQNPSLKTGIATLHNPPSHGSRGETVHGDPVQTETLADIERAIGRSIVRAVRVAQAREQTAGPGRDRAPRRVRSRKNR